MFKNSFIAHSIIVMFQALFRPSVKHTLALFNIVNAVKQYSECLPSQQVHASYSLCFWSPDSFRPKTVPKNPGAQMQVPLSQVPPFWHGNAQALESIQRNTPIDS